MIGAWVEEHVAKEGLGDAWTLLARQWLEQLQSALAGYVIEESDDFLLLSAGDAESNGRLLHWCHWSRATILEELDRVAREEGYGKHVVLALGDWDTYYDYVADFDPEAGEFAPSAGIFIDRGYGHFAVCTEARRLCRTNNRARDDARHAPSPAFAAMAQRGHHAGGRGCGRRQLAFHVGRRTGSAASGLLERQLNRRLLVGRVISHSRGAGTELQPCGNPGPKSISGSSSQSA